MKITVTNIITKKDNTLDIPITKEQLNRWLNGELIQNAMPELDPELREFLISGFLPGDFNKLFGPKVMLCKKCGKSKLETEFNETSMGAKIKRITTCKSCQSEYNAIDYQKRKNMKNNLEFFESGRATCKSITFDKNAQDALPQHIKDKMKANRDSTKKRNYNKTINTDFSIMVAIFNSFGFDVASFDCMNEAEDCCEVFNLDCIIKCGGYYNVIIDL